MSDLAQQIMAIIEDFAPSCVELSFIMFFALGFIFLRGDTVRRGKHDSKNSASKGSNLRGFDTKLKKAVEAGATAATVLEAWRTGQAKAPTPKDLIKPVVQAFIDTEPEALVRELVEHVQLHKESLLNSFTGTTTLDVVARSGNIMVLEHLWQAFERDLNLHRNNFMCDVMLGGYASTGNSAKVREFCKQMSQNKLRLSPRGYSLIIKGFLKNSMLDAVLEYIVQMKQRGHAVPAFAVTQFLRLASDRGTSESTYASLKEAGVEVQQEALTVMLEDAARHFKPKLTRLIEAEARAANIKLSTQAYDALLKVYAQDCNLDACKIFKEMQMLGTPSARAFALDSWLAVLKGSFLALQMRLSLSSGLVLA